MYTPSKEHLRHVLLYEFQKGSTVSSAAKSLEKKRLYSEGRVEMWALQRTHF